MVLSAGNRYVPENRNRFPKTYRVAIPSRAELLMPSATFFQSWASEATRFEFEWGRDDALPVSRNEGLPLFDRKSATLANESQRRIEFELLSEMAAQNN